MTAQEEQQDFHREYYEKNKMSILEKKRDRYQNDPAYREAVKARTRQRYEAKVKREKPLDRMVIRAEEGNYFSIGKVADAIGRKVGTVRAYHKRGIIPDTGYSDKRGWRLYTREQLRIIASVFVRFDAGRLDSLDAVSEVLKKKMEG